MKEELRFYCVIHDNEVVTSMPTFTINPFDIHDTSDIPMYAPDYCKSQIYDLEGATCVFQWELPGRKLIYTSWVRNHARKVAGTKLYSRVGLRGP